MRSAVFVVSLAALASVVTACTATIPPGMTPISIPTRAAQPSGVVDRSTSSIPASTRAPQSTAQSIPTAVPSTAGPGSSREDPLGLGTEFSIGDWRVSVESVDTDAWDVIQVENQFNSPPPTGRQFVLFTLSATYEGEDTGNAWIDLAWRVVGAGGNTFGGSMDDYCGVIPDGLSNAGETFPGGTVTGTECISVENNQVDGATLMAQDFLTDTRVFTAIE